MQNYDCVSRAGAVNTLTPGSAINYVLRSSNVTQKYRTRYSHCHGERPRARAEYISIVRKYIFLKLDMCRLEELG